MLDKFAKPKGPTLLQTETQILSNVMGNEMYTIKNIN